MDVLEDVLPTPTMNPNDFGKFKREDLLKVIETASTYQGLIDILMTHPALVYLKKETQINL